MTQCLEEIQDIIGSRDPWQDARAVIGDRRVTLGPQASQQWLDAPEHLCMVMGRYRAAAALIGNALNVLEMGCGEGLGAGILAKNREMYVGIDSDIQAIATANGLLPERPRVDRRRMTFATGDIVSLPYEADGGFDAVVSLDVIEHIAAECESDLMDSIGRHLTEHGVCVIGTPNAAFEHLASPQSRAGHINLYTHERLHALMSKHFRTVQSFGMQDTSLHLGHPDARHYLLMCGIGPR